MSEGDPTTRNEPAAPAALPRLLTVKEVAALLAISEGAVRDLCVAGYLPHLRVGVTASRGGRGRIRIYEADVVAYLEKARVDAPATISIEEASGRGRRGRRSANTEAFTGGCELLRAAGWKG